MNNKKDLELYIHIPFCISKCSYCDFVSAPAVKKEVDTYCHNLLLELASYGSIDASNGDNPIEDYVVRSIFIGGGTPSSIEAAYIRAIMEKIGQVFWLAPEHEIEVTIEANPGTLTRDKLLAYRACGINRLSLGLQSTDNAELKRLGRIHTFETFLENYRLARECGFRNINIDLMSALPGQTVQSWEATLSRIISLEPEHLSAYSLIIEEGTPFFDCYSENPELLPDEEAEREMYHLTKHLLEQAGYTRYEISNYAKAGYACRHNLGYWERTPYLGFGLAAASLFGEKRFQNPASHSQYSDYVKGGCRHTVESLTRQEQIEEFMFLGLRKMAGVSKEAFLQAFAQPVGEVYQEVVEKLCKEQLLQENETHLFLTEKGIDLANYVMAEFLN